MLCNSLDDFYFSPANAGGHASLLAVSRSIAQKNELAGAGKYGAEVEVARFHISITIATANQWH